jgi:hypothetical protein
MSYDSNTAAGRVLDADRHSVRSEPIATVAYGFGIISVTGPAGQLKRWAGSGEAGSNTDVALDEDQVLSVAIE